MIVTQFKILTRKQDEVLLQLPSLTIFPAKMHQVIISLIEIDRSLPFEWRDGSSIHDHFPSFEFDQVLGGCRRSLSAKKKRARHDNGCSNDYQVKGKILMNK